MITKRNLQEHSNLDKRENYLNKMQEDYTRIIKSINEYKGFYIGRYEIGDDVSHNYDLECFIHPKIVRYNNNINCVTWYNSYKDLERLSGKTEKYSETGMIYDSLVDYTLKWLNETDTRSYKDIAEDSGTWGNYQKNKITVKSGSEKPSESGAIETIIYKGEICRNSPTASNNIFDLAGNVYEWTKARETERYRCLKGGYYNIENYPAYGTNIGYPENNSYSYGARGMLLIR